mmetsp:Transcript_4331/g.7584  ORF Transcript_4331/g.7584 Transcript_4331/m.7584 type:complete len:611 (+) Transcript_4331:223-2055(+)
MLIGEIPRDERLRFVANEPLATFIEKYDVDGEWAREEEVEGWEVGGPEDRLDARGVYDEHHNEQLHRNRPKHESVFQVVDLEHGEESGLGSDEAAELADDDCHEHADRPNLHYRLPLRSRRQVAPAVVDDHRGAVIMRFLRPVCGGARKLRGVEALVVVDHKVREHCPRRLHNANLEVRIDEQRRAGEAVRADVPGWPLHDVGLSVFVGEGDAGEDVGAEVDYEDEDRGEGDRDPDGEEQEQRNDLGAQVRQHVRDGLLQVVEHQATFFDAGNDGGEVIVEEDHEGGLLGHVRARYTHGHPDVGALEGRRVIHAIPSHGHNAAALLLLLHNRQLLRRGRPGKDDLFVGEDAVPVCICEGGDFAAGHHNGVHSVADRLLWNLIRFGNILHGRRRDDPHLARNCLSCDWMIARDHDNLDAGRLAQTHGTGNALFGGINEGDQADEAERLEGEVGCVGLQDLQRSAVLAVDRQVREANDPLPLGRKLLDRRLDVFHRLRCDWLRLSSAKESGAALKNAVGGALHADEAGVGERVVVERGGVLVLAVERHLGQACVQCPRLFDVLDALAELDECALRRVAEGLPLRDGLVVGRWVERCFAAQAHDAAEDIERCI